MFRGSVENTAPVSEKEVDKKEEKSADSKKEAKVEKKLTPAEYRRLHP